MKQLSRMLPVAIALAIPASFSHGAPVLIGTGSLTLAQDLSGLTGTLENGLPANTFGGIGSGLAYAGGNEFFALPDRGPNATPYSGGGAVDNTTSYIPRFHSVNLSLMPNASGLPFTVSASLTKTTLFSSATPLIYAAAGNLPAGAPGQNTPDQFYFSGRADNFVSGSSSNPQNARLDPEAIRVSNDGLSVFISDEYGPYVYQFNRATGERVKTFSLPDSLATANSQATEAAEIAGNKAGRTTNKGMEGLAITPDGKTLVGIMQAPLLQDTNKTVRIVTINIQTGATQEYAYKLTDGSGVSEIVAINDHEFLVDERDGKGLGDNSSAAVKKIYKIDLAGAASVAGLAGDLSAKAVAKTAFLDVKTALVDAGIQAKNIPAKIEGMTFGEDITLNGSLLHTLWITNDNDYLSLVTDSGHPDGQANPNNFYVFGISDADLPGFSSQKVNTVPLPSTLTLMLGGVGFLGLLRRRGQK